MHRRFCFLCDCSFWSSTCQLPPQRTLERLIQSWLAPSVSSLAIHHASWLRHSIAGFPHTAMDLGTIPVSDYDAQDVHAFVRRGRHSNGPNYFDVTTSSYTHRGPLREFAHKYSLSCRPVRNSLAGGRLRYVGTPHSIRSHM